METGSRIVVTQGWRAGCGGEAADASFCSEENILELDSADGQTTL